MLAAVRRVESCACSASAPVRNCRRTSANTPGNRTRNMEDRQSAFDLCVRQAQHAFSACSTLSTGRTCTTVAARRQVTTTAPQALLLLNGDFTPGAADKLGADLLAKYQSTNGKPDRPGLSARLGPVGDGGGDQARHGVRGQAEIVARSEDGEHGTCSGDRGFLSCRC